MLPQRTLAKPADQGEMDAMMTKPDHYSSVAKALHWTMALMILSLIPVGLIMHNMPASSLKFTIYQLHKSFGLIVLVLAVARLGWRLGHPVPPLPDNLKPWERIAARVTHVGFYALIIIIPLVGWMMVSASPTGIPTKIFYTIPVPHFPLPSSKRSGLCSSQKISLSFCLRPTNIWPLPRWDFWCCTLARR